MTFNPYAPPESNSQYEGLSADTEFLISDKCILCGDEVNLPKVCIITGTSYELVEQQSTLKWTPDLLYKFRLILLVMLFPALSILPAALLPGTAATVFDYAVVAIPFAVVVGNLIAWYLSFRLRRRVEVTWHVAKRHHLRQEKRRSQWKSGGVLGLVLCGRSLYGAFSGDVFWQNSVALLAIFTLVCFIKSRQREQPVIAGRHEGLNILTGFSPEFMQNVNAMIEGQGNTQN